MRCNYTYFPRALRHFTDFLSLLDGIRAENIGDFIIEDYKQHGIEVRIALKSSEGRQIDVTYHRFGLLIVSGPNEVTPETIATIADKFWALAFKNSVISKITFETKISSPGRVAIECADENDHATGFSLAVLDILDRIGDHNRVLFRELENSYRTSPYKDFIDLVQTDKFMSLSVHYSRLHQIRADITELSNYYASKLTADSKGKLANVEAESEYLIRLVDLTRTFFDKRYDTSIKIRESRRTRAAIVIAIIACLAAILALLPLLNSNSTVKDKPAQSEVEKVNAGPVNATPVNAVAANASSVNATPVNASPVNTNPENGKSKE